MEPLQALTRCGSSRRGACRPRLQAACSLHQLLVARDRGYRLAALYSSADGFAVYRRLGFAELFRAELYVWESCGAR